MLRLIQGKLPGRAGRRSLPAPAGVARFVSIALTIGALWLLSAACLASETPSCSASRPLVAPTSWDQSSAIADLDGDGLPDFATVRAEGRGAEGFSYRIELQLSACRGSRYFRVSAAQGGLHIVPRDVDGDGDLDLVITTAWSRAPVGVWINDGHGVFTQGDAAAYPSIIWTEGPNVLSQTRLERFQAAVPQSYRSCSESSIASRLHPDVLVRRLAFVPVTANPLTIATRRPQTRAPPRAFPQQSS